jgi:F-type H+-transporting ATPase subunit b
MPQFETHFFSSLIFWEIVSFAILFYVLARYAFPPILEALDARARKIRESIETAERHRAEADRRLVEYEAKMKAAHREAEILMEQAKTRAQHLLEENERRLTQEADRIKAAAGREIDQERRRALEEVRGYATELALRVAEKLMERSLTDDDHKRLAEESLAAVAKDYAKS